MSPEELETRLRAAMQEAQRRGWVIARGVGVDAATPRCCALGAVAVVDGLMASRRWFNLHDTIRHLGLTSYQADAFIGGFDRGYLYSSTDPYCQLGRRLAAEFVR